MRIAVIGAGISGLASAYYLARRHDVVLFEQDGRIGGHTNTVMVGRQAVDTGWIVYNGLNYPNLTALFRDLEVTTRPTQMSFGVSIGNGAYEWAGSDALWTVFAQPSNLLRPRHLRMLVDLLRLNARCRRLLAARTLPAGSLGDFLRDAGFTPDLSSRYLLPMAGLIWSCSPRKALEYPAADFMRFFEAHGLFTATGQPQWRTVVGGSHQYVQKLLATFSGQLRRSTPVRSVRRSATGVEVDGEVFDAAVSAVHSDQALALLADASAEERGVLAGIPYNRSACVLHTDTSFLPRRRAAWASWNYLHPDDSVHDQPISGSYWMNLLQGIPGPTNYVVTLNPQREIPSDRILYRTTYEHPHYGAASVRTHERLPAIQGRRGLWWAGAWTGYGFHEDGLKSALRVVAGIDRECLPAWATL